MIRSEGEGFPHRERDRPSRARPIGAIIDRLGVDPATMPRDALSSTSVTSSHSPALSRARGRGGGAKNGGAPKTILRRTWCASASARRNGCSLRGRVAPRERDRPPPLPPRPPVCSCSGSDRADTDPTRRRRSEEERERERRREQERRREGEVRGGTSGTRGRNGIEVEREETINNTRGKTKKRMSGGSAGGSRKYDLLGPSLSSRHLPRGGFREHARLLKTASRARR